LLKHHHSLWLDFFFLDVFSPKDASFVKLKAAPDWKVTRKLLVAVSFAAENKAAVSHFHNAMKFIWIKVVGHTEELQLMTFCDKRENVEARALYTCLCCEKKKKKMPFKAIRQDVTCFMAGYRSL